jgi:hypothetical protein
MQMAPTGVDLTFRGGRCLLVVAIVLFWAVEVFAQATAAAPRPDLHLQAMRLLEQGHTADAGAVLQRLIDEEPNNAGAYLDVAILHCSMGDAAKAEALFAAMEARFSPPPAILEVIARQRALGCKPHEPTAQLRLRLGRGYDDNVNQGASGSVFSLGTGASAISVVVAPEYARRGDGFTALSLDWSAPLPGGAGTIGYVQAGARSYDALRLYDQAFVSGALEHPWQAGSWGMRSVGSVGLLTLGGAVYQQQAQLRLVATPPLGLPAGWKLDGALGLTEVAYPTQTPFDAQQWDARAVLVHAGANGFVQAELGYTWDKGKSLRPGGDRQGVLANLQGRILLGQNIYGEWGLTYQGWLGQRAYSPGLIDQRREQDSVVARAGLVVPLARSHGLFIEWRTVQNRENIALFEYQSQSLQVGWQWQAGH